GGPSRFEALLALNAGRRLPDPDDAVGAADLRHWFRAQACRAYPGFAAFATLSQQAWTAADTTLELVGMARSATGLGQNTAMSAAALSAAGIDFRLRDIEDGFAPLPAPGGAEARPPSCRPRRKAMLLHLNADQAPQALCHPLFDRHADLYAIGFFLWELEALPGAHRLALDLVDEIWCPSQFLADIYAAHTSRPVHCVGKAITLPAPRIPDRRRFGLDHTDFVFLTCFDFHSSVERKNPLAAVEAFQRAFPRTPGAARPGASRGRRGAAAAPQPRLVIKTTPPVDGHWGDPHGMWRRIEAVAATDPRIVIVTDHLPFAEFVGMIAMADALVSTHRAEGFGYLPAFALALARPVLATDYGGTRDFLRVDTGFPIAWTPRDIAPGETILPVPGAFWADIDRDALAAAMTALIERPEEGRRRALEGRRLIDRAYAPSALAARYRERLHAAGIIA
ncbi:MAG: glycosyltransferase family 4 protein, partial [Pseudomonadota bacterium]